MKSSLMLSAIGACLFAVAGVTTAAQPPQDAQSSGKAAMQENANMSAQSSTDMSYGGVADSRSTSGGMQPRKCSTGPQCDIFFGQ
jgi:hypothetical protein